jgi:murein DD-endopeptidase MepM/ murein hydrolase activator NlpD
MKKTVVLLFLLLAARAARGADVVVSTLPATPLIERTKSGQALNFDLLIENKSAEKLTLDEIEVSVLGANDALVVQRRLASNGDSIATLPNRTVEPGGKLVVFNPFAEFDSGVDLASLRYDLTFGERHAGLTVKPVAYTTKAALILPVGGRLFVHDGHDFYSHHRRLDITGGMTTALHIDSNMTRYAYDFTVIDEQGRMHRGGGDDNADWYGFGQPVVAPADGVVVKAASDRPDGSQSKRAPLDFEAVMKDLTLIFGNYAILDHGNGEFSLLGHMKQGSVTVKPGDRVKRGQAIGAIGCSGDSMFPHLHYQLQRDAGTGEGLPSPFNDYRRFTGKSWVTVKRGHVDSGDVVQSR